MKSGEVRTFEIDTKKKQNCGLPKKLPGKDIVEVKIKLDRSPGRSIFAMVGREEGAYVYCYPAYLQQLEVRGDAKQCGIGTILTKLCFNEDNIHNVENNTKNVAVQMIKNWSKRPGSTDKLRLQKLEKWATEKCSKMLFIDVVPTPKSAAHGYLSSAMASGFTEMFIKIDEDMYPPTGPCSVKTLKERYRESGNMVDKDGETEVWGNHWYFCYPKNPAVKYECSIL